MDLPFLLESRLTLLGLTDGCSSVSVDILRLQLDETPLRLAPLGGPLGSEGPVHSVSADSACVGAERAWRRQVCARGRTGSWERNGLQP